MNKNSVPSVEKTIELLNELAIQELSQAQLSVKLGIPMSTTYRILCSLKAAQWVRKNPDSTYKLDNGLLSLTTGIQNDIARWEPAQRIVNELTKRYNLSCKLSIRRGNRQYTLFRAEPENEPVVITGKPGSSFPIVEGSVGAALLWRETPDDVRRMCRDCAENIREKSDPEYLIKLIHSIKENGYALNLAVRRWSIAAMSVPLPGPDGVDAALTLLGAVEDFSGENSQKYGRILMNAADKCKKLITQKRGE